VIDAPIGIRNGTTKRTVHGGRVVKPAVTEYKVVGKFREVGYTLIQAFPKTGRTHQIRVHLASIGHPIAGDRLYGGNVQPGWAGRMMLHASAIEFTGPDGKRLKFEAEAPF